MIYLKRVTKSFIISFTSFVVLLLLSTLLCYLNILKGNILVIINLLIPLLSIFIGAYDFCKKHGWLDGIIYGSIFIIILLIINLLFYSNFKFKNLIYYLILLITSILGGIVGINKKKNIATN